MLHDHGDWETLAMETWPSGRFTGQYTMHGTGRCRKILEVLYQGAKDFLMRFVSRCTALLAEKVTSK